MSGPSRPLDPSRHPVRRDLADVRLAEYVFAPHYAAPLPMVVIAPTPLRAGPEEEAAILATLAVGEIFEALDFAHGKAWGVAGGRPGYVPRDALATKEAR
ncbi:MAG: SH3 domain-containing protein [Sphingomonas sp.]|uniref:SH3 domain-containing protein n=1 Tax=Sphingomonas sp. TaxID=28214 RepID=UPI000A09EEFC|nr:SH3 domain-containing protein [Sphingomonas sp.]MBX9883078.1 SH3 domain-containing protein [Sphingomonas sp.]OQW47029.1 MAG: hypothetical protein A4S16_09390 [Proteobacteria bacterium SG_bin6]